MPLNWNFPKGQTPVRLGSIQGGNVKTPSEAGVMGGRGNKADSNATSVKDRGATYILRRLKRDRPSALKDVIAKQKRWIEQL
jgi:hypothetical protein